MKRRTEELSLIRFLTEESTVKTICLNTGERSRNHMESGKRTAEHVLQLSNAKG